MNTCPASPLSWFRIIAAVFILGTALAAHGNAATYIDETFTGETAAGWVFTAGQGDNPFLTASTIDTPGEGWLRLNSDSTNQATFSYHQQAVPTSAGLVIMFDFVIWGTANSPGDGFAVTLFEPNATPSPGGYGGSLGYAQRTNIEGMSAAVMGIGFDTFGNFSRASEGRVGGPGQRAHSIAVRGPMGANRNEGYAYIGGTETLSPFSTVGANTTRNDATVRTARITITSSAAIQVEWREENGSWESLLICACPDGNLPEELMIGFTAGTGAARSTHEIRNLSVSAIPEPQTAILFVASVFFFSFVRRNRCQS